MAQIEQVEIGNRFHRYYQRLQPIMKKPRNRATTTAVFSFLAISLFVFYAIRPTAQTIIFLKREITDKTALNQKMEDKISALIEAQTNYESIQDKLPFVDEALPQNPDAIILARKLKNLAAESGATVSAMQIPNLPIIAGEATPGAKLAGTASKTVEFPVNIVLHGSYTSLKAFLEGLTNMRRITTIDMMSFKHSTGLSSDPTALQLTARLKSYYIQ